MKGSAVFWVARELVCFEIGSRQRVHFLGICTEGAHGGFSGVPLQFAKLEILWRFILSLLGR